MLVENQARQEMTVFCLFAGKGMFISRRLHPRAGLSRRRSFFGHIYGNLSASACIACIEKYNHEDF